jgi:hypothetical protein
MTRERMLAQLRQA